MFVSSENAVYLSASERSALESSALRWQLFLASLRLTVKHPIFGVGPGMFSVANGQAAAAQAGGRVVFDAWHETHNTFTQITSEDGIPALLFYCAGLFLCFMTLRRLRKVAHIPESKEVAQMVFCLRLSLIAFTGTAVFASNAYAYYFPLLAGLCVAFDRAVTARLQNLPETAATATQQLQTIAPSQPARPRDLPTISRRTPEQKSALHGDVLPGTARSSGSGPVRW
jgi:O-antigen ligase